MNDKRSQPQWSASGVVEAPVNDVWQALLEADAALTPADRTAIAHDRSGQFTKTTGQPGQGRIHVEVDSARRSIAIQGEWWYRGVHSVESHERGSLLTYRVYNVAPGIGWWAAQFVQGAQHARTMDGQVQVLLRAIGQKLGCDAYLI
jgi:hypothetical protein